MTLEQLRIFVAVAEREHVTRAARVLNLTQSAASAAIAALEADHGVALFDRVGRGIALTEAGRLFLDEARAVLARATAAEQALADLAGLARGSLAVAASQTIASYWLPQRLVAFRRRYPGLALRLRVGNTAYVARAVRDGEAELGFIEGAIDDDTLRATVIDHDRMIVVTAAGHPWASRTSLSPGEIAAADWVLREPGSGTRSVFEADLAAFGVDPASLTVILELPSNEAVRAAVEAGAGATALSALVAEAGLRAGLLARAPIDLPERPFYALRHRERRPSRAGEALMALAGGG